MSPQEPTPLPGAEARDGGNHEEEITPVVAATETATATGTETETTARRQDSKKLRQVATSELREKLKDQKGKLADRKEQLKKMSKPPGGFDPTPLPDAPQGYTVKFTFHRAFNLPIADLHLKSSDPFIHATLKAAVPKRHKEDPLLTHRTRTKRRTTEPVWEEEWIVANVPATGFELKCRLYDEDWPDHDDRLGNVTVRVPRVDENWEGFGPEGRVFDVKKRSGSKRAYLLRAASVAVCKGASMTPKLKLGVQVLGKSDPPHAQMYTVGPTTWVKHYSPMIGRLAGIKVNRDEEEDAVSDRESERPVKKYDFQANEIQLSGPVPPRLYHRYVEFRPMIGRMFSSSGLRGRVLRKVLHKQHNRIYNFDSSTEYGAFEPCTEEASLQFLRMAHFDEGGRIFTYVITLDGMMRFTETGKEFGIDLLSKHTMHSDVATYIACSGEFFIRRLEHPVHNDREGRGKRSAASSRTRKKDHERSRSSSSSFFRRSNKNKKPAHADPNPDGQPTHPPQHPPGGPPHSAPPPEPKLYQLTIDNDSGTYRPDSSVLPDLQAFLSRNLPGMHVTAMDCADEQLIEMKKAQHEAKKREGPRIRMVLNRSPSSSSFSSDDESRLGAMDDDETEDGDKGKSKQKRKSRGGLRSKKERAFDVVSEPARWREVLGFEEASGSNVEKGKEKSG
ncbi:uncharacterized protein C8A04DRAFT_37944 [Dichotomopilus funicola]|uniref:C2 domain-containing protein n=1 Tax=Dichotomopilus funicola TaxID=1934379 RepID=A0AAN6V139_9PEZI|nr:hypothetical protein C8A04DRAFT_37944 [Dichotomopilus funicola]